MGELERTYVIDMAVPKEEFEAACNTFAQVFGIDGVRTTGDHDKTGQVEMVHFPVGGLNVFGIMTVMLSLDDVPEESRRRGFARMIHFLEAHPQGGVYLIGGLVDSIDEYTDRLKDLGLPLEFDEPQAYFDGRLMITEVVHGTVWEFAQHTGPEVTGLWDGRRQEASGAGIDRAYRIDVAVRDLVAATEAVRNLLGREPEPRNGVTDQGSLVGVDFPVGGLRSLGLVSPSGAPRGALARAVNDYLGAYGEGPILTGFSVLSLEETRARVQKVGASFQYAEHQAGDDGLTNITDPIHGVVLQFTEVSS